MLRELDLPQVAGMVNSESSIKSGPTPNLELAQRQMLIETNISILKIKLSCLASKGGKTAIKREITKHQIFLTIQSH
jgi:hypothetical protein